MENSSNEKFIYQVILLTDLDILSSVSVIHVLSFCISLRCRSISLICSEVCRDRDRCLSPSHLVKCKKCVILTKKYIFRRKRKWIFFFIQKFRENTRFLTKLLPNYLPINEKLLANTNVFFLSSCQISTKQMSAFFDHLSYSFLMSIQFGHVTGIIFKLAPNMIQIVRNGLHSLQLIFGINKPFQNIFMELTEGIIVKQFSYQNKNIFSRKYTYVYNSFITMRAT